MMRKAFKLDPITQRYMEVYVDCGPVKVATENTPPRRPLAHRDGTKQNVGRKVTNP